MTPRGRAASSGWRARSLRSWTDAVCLALWATAGGIAIGGQPSAAIPLVLISTTATAARFARASAAVESAFVTLLAVDAWLTCSGLMAKIDRQDVAGHLILTAAVTPVLAAAIRKTFPRLPHSVRWAAVVGLVTGSLALGWEVVEACFDSLLGTY